MELNVITFTYLFLRLAPFILVCFFSLASIFNQDFKGLVYLVGLLFACFVTVMFGNVLPITGTPIESKPAICSMITLGGQGELSKLPLGQCVFGYTYAYLMYIIANPKANLVKQNIPTIVFFPILIAFDFSWNVRYQCYNWLQLLAGLALGGVSGYLWAMIIDSTKTDSLKYFSGYNNKEVCSKPSKQTFKCSVFQGGKKLISKNIGG